MITDMTFDTFWKTYREVAEKIANNRLWGFKGEASYWDSRIDEAAICEESIANAMQIVYKKYNPVKGNLYGFLKTVIHNEMFNLLEVEKESLSMVKDISPRMEKDFTWGQMTSEIPDSYMNELISRLRYAIGQLMPMDQAILNFYIDNPKTYIQKSVDAFDIKENLVSLRKNRAMKILPKLMRMTPSDYFDMYEEGQRGISLGFLTTKTQESKQENFVYPEFNLDTTVTKVANIIRILKGEI